MPVEDHMLSRRSLVPRLLAAAAVSGGLLPAAHGAAQTGRGASAPEFTGIDGWLNTDAPLTLAGLRGKVVLVDFWTYSCINCRRTVPYLNRWQAEYGARGLQVIGIHTPEFGFERTRRNVAESVREFGIRYPVGQDNGFRTWRAWTNRAWPAFYLLDRDGRIVLVREGEGHAHELEDAIRALLGVAPGDAMAGSGDDPDLSRIRTPEIYFGALHPTPQDRAQSPRAGEAAYAFRAAAGPRLNQYQLDGTWARQDEALVLRSAQGGLRVRFSAAKLHLVAAAPRPAPLRVQVDGGRPQTVEVERPTLYTLLDGETYGEHVLEFESDTPGLSLFSATFG
jgi:thiol-disulfide isomerase/thioredoxin